MRLFELLEVCGGEDTMVSLWTEQGEFLERCVAGDVKQRLMNGREVVKIYPKRGELRIVTRLCAELQESEEFLEATYFEFPKPAKGVTINICPDDCGMYQFWKYQTEELSDGIHVCDKDAWNRFTYPELRYTP